jgi:bacterial/archaeal transporter family-2 protein
MNAWWIYPFIILGGALQTCGASMNAQLNTSLGNKWIASTVSFALIFAFFISISMILPRPLPTVSGIASMPWWAPLGGLVGAVQVYAGLTLVNKVGSGPFIGFTVTAALIMSILIDHFGWFRMPVHPANAGRVLGGLLLIAGVALVARF